ncbi:hypothetical protein Y032_0449g1655 [Ancylostoma ceylanicum]|nr:hypothetical protein Y032_0449g1655 [Ancylostoma ceylanicum]
MRTRRLLLALRSGFHQHEKLSLCFFVKDVVGEVPFVKVILPQIHTNLLIMFVSLAPFPNSTWSATTNDTNITMDSYYISGEAFNVSEPLFLSEPLWNQPADALWQQPSDHERKLPLPPMPAIQERLYVATMTENRCFEQTAHVRELQVLAEDSTQKTDSSQARVRGKTAAKDECGYCRSVGRPATGHAKTACPVLFSMKPCSLCGADGYENHTET